jgi:hypothetical protein
MVQPKKISRPQKRRQIRKWNGGTVAAISASQPKPGRRAARSRQPTIRALAETCAVSPEAHNLAS